MSMARRSGEADRWRRLLALAALRVAAAEQRVFEVETARQLALGELDDIGSYCARRIAGLAGVLAPLSLAAADRRRRALLAAMRRLEEAGVQAAGELEAARRSIEKCRARLAVARRDEHERRAAEEGQEHVARRAIAAIPRQASSGKVGLGGRPRSWDDR